MATSSAAPGPDYPCDWQRTAQTRDGILYRIRPIRPDDTERERSFIEALSPESRYTRLMSTMGAPAPELVERFVHVDYRRSMAFVAVEGSEDAEHIIGVARYAQDRSSRSEFAVAVLDRWQSRGVGTELSRLLFEYARSQGIRSLYAIILAANRPMIALALRLGMSTEPFPGDPGLILASCRL